MVDKRLKQKAAGIYALRLAGFENVLFMKVTPAPVGRAKATLRRTYIEMRGSKAGTKT
jgi:hypothetical protein